MGGSGSQSRAGSYSSHRLCPACAAQAAVRPSSPGCPLPVRHSSDQAYSGAGLTRGNRTQPGDPRQRHVGGEQREASRVLRHIGEEVGKAQVDARGSVLDVESVGELVEEVEPLQLTGCQQQAAAQLASRQPFVRSTRPFSPGRGARQRITLQASRREGFQEVQRGWRPCSSRRTRSSMPPSSACGSAASWVANAAVPCRAAPTASARRAGSPR
jgi:hypothetical protein